MLEYNKRGAQQSYSLYNFFKGCLGGLFLYDSEGNLIEDKYLQGEAAKMHLCFFIAEPQRIALCAIPSA